MATKILLLKDADFVIRDSSTIEKSSSVVIQGNLIAEVGKAETLERKYAFDEIHDCRGHIILPGLINCHTHINETMMRGLGHDLNVFDWFNKLVFPMAQAMESEGDELYYRVAQFTAMEAISSGTTALVENNANFGKRHAYALAKALSDFGIRGAIAKGAEDYSPIDYGHVSSTENEIKETREFIEKWKREKNDLVQAWIGPSGGKRAVGGCTSTLLRELKRLAKSFQIHTHMHLASSLGERELVRKETNFPGSIAYANDLGLLDECTSLAHCVWMTEEEQTILKSTRTKVVHCPSTAQIHVLGVQPLPELLEQGTICAIGTDGAPTNDSFDMFRETRQAILLHRIHAMSAAAISHIQAFRMATEFGASVLGIENLGKIEKGYLADIVSIRVGDNLYLNPVYDPLETIVYACSGGRDVAMTIVNGKILYKNGEFKTVDAKKIISQIRESAIRLERSIKF